MKLNTFYLLLVLILSGCTTIENGLFATGLAVERTMSGFEEKSIQLSDHQWHYLESGELSQPTILLLHGFGADKDNWVRMSRHLQGFRIIAPDLPGHGESSFNGNLFYGFDVQSRRLAEFVDALQLSEFTLVGNSMGGAVAALYAYRHPQKVTSLVLIDAVGFYGDEASELEQRLNNGKSNPLIVRDDEAYQEFLDFVLEDQPFLPWPAKSVLGRKAAQREQANDHIFEHIYQEVEAARYAGGFGHIFSKLLMPTLVIWGEQDRVLDVSSVDKFFDYIPEAEVEILPSVGHAPMIERPAVTANLIQNFWQRQTLLSSQPSGSTSYQDESLSQEY